LVHGGSPRFVVHGTRGSYIKYGMDPQEDALKAGRTPGGPNWGHDSHDGVIFYQENGEQHSDIIPTLPGDYPAFYRGIRDVIEQGGEPPVTTTEAIRVMTILELASRSAAKGLVIPMPNPNNPPLRNTD
jgi:scyllo-inositol 2-dehydrogenase (NADP+)